MLDDPDFAAGYALPPELVDELETPALVVYLDRVRANLGSVIALAGGDPDRWRPHVKTAKIPRVFAEYARAGVRHFKCATVREARHLLAVLREEGAGGADVLVAYPLVGPALRRLGELARAHPETRVSVLCEDADAVAEVPVPVSVFVDVNPGMDRTGVAADDVGAALAVARAAGGRFRGLHGYDGHLHEGGWEERGRAAHACYDRLLALAGGLREAGVTVGEVITSGTPTFAHALEYPGFRRADLLHRVSPGTVVYHDLRTAETCERLELVPAALVLTRVVSRPGPRLVTCDAGNKAVAAEAGDPCAVALGRPGLVARTPNEEHLPFDVVSGPVPARGETLLLFPRHVCPTVNLAEEAVLMEDGRLEGVVPVSARAHDLRA